MYAQPRKLARDTILRWNGVQIEEQHANGMNYKDLARKRKLRSLPARPAALNQNWMSYAALAGAGTLSTRCRFLSYWTVPEPPKEDNYTLFLFAALLDESLQHILQPVLQWYPTASGAPQGSWGLQTWYVGPNVRDERVSNPIIPIAPGSNITGEIETYNGFATASFVGYPDTLLTVHGLPDMTTAMLALEAYKGRSVPNHVPLMPPDEKIHAKIVSTNYQDLSSFSWDGRGPWSARVIVDDPADGTIEFAYGSG